MNERIQLARDARERVYLTMVGDPPFTTDATVAVQMVGTTVWYEATVTSPGDPLRAEIYFAGPAADTSGAIAITASGLFRVRIVDNGETIPRGGGYIALVD